MKPFESGDELKQTTSEYIDNKEEDLVGD